MEDPINQSQNLHQFQTTPSNTTQPEIDQSDANTHIIEETAGIQSPEQQMAGRVSDQFKDKMGELRQQVMDLRIIKGNVKEMKARQLGSPQGKHPLEKKQEELNKNIPILAKDLLKIVAEKKAENPSKEALQDLDHLQASVNQLLDVAMDVKARDAAGQWTVPIERKANDQPFISEDARKDFGDVSDAFWNKLEEIPLIRRQRDEVEAAMDALKGPDGQVPADKKELFEGLESIKRRLNITYTRAVTTAEKLAEGPEDSKFHEVKKGVLHDLVTAAQSAPAGKTMNIDAKFMIRSKWEAKVALVRSKFVKARNLEAYHVAQSKVPNNVHGDADSDKEKKLLEEANDEKNMLKAHLDFIEDPDLKAEISRQLDDVLNVEAERTDVEHLNSQQLETLMLAGEISLEDIRQQIASRLPHLSNHEKRQLAVKLDKAIDVHLSQADKGKRAHLKRKLAGVVGRSSTERARKMLSSGALAEHTPKARRKHYQKKVKELTKQVTADRKAANKRAEAAKKQGDTTPVKGPTSLQEIGRDWIANAFEVRGPTFLNVDGSWSSFAPKGSQQFEVEGQQKYTFSPSAQSEAPFLETRAKEGFDAVVNLMTKSGGHDVPPQQRYNIGGVLPQNSPYKADLGTLTGLDPVNDNMDAYSYTTPDGEDDLNVWNYHGLLDSGEALSPQQQDELLSLAMDIATLNAEDKKVEVHCRQCEKRTAIVHLLAHVMQNTPPEQAQKMSIEELQAEILRVQYDQIQYAGSDPVKNPLSTVLGQLMTDKSFIRNMQQRMVSREAGPLYDSVTEQIEARKAAEIEYQEARNQLEVKLKEIATSHQDYDLEPEKAKTLLIELERDKDLIVPQVAISHEELLSDWEDTDAELDWIEDIFLDEPNKPEWKEFVTAWMDPIYLLIYCALDDDTPFDEIPEDLKLLAAQIVFDEDEPTEAQIDFIPVMLAAYDNVYIQQT